jgi:hypothetical protein
MAGLSRRGQWRPTPPHSNRQPAGLHTRAHAALLTRIAAANDRDGLVAEHGRRAVADSAGGDALVPEAAVLVRPREGQPPRHCAGGNNDGICHNLLLVCRQGRQEQGRRAVQRFRAVRR